MRETNTYQIWLTRAWRRLGEARGGGLPACQGDEGEDNRGRWWRWGGGMVVQGMGGWGEHQAEAAEVVCHGPAGEIWSTRQRQW